MPATPPLRRYRVAGCSSFVLAAVGFVTAVAFELALPGAEITRILFWAGVAAIVCFFATVYLSLSRVLGLRGSSREEVREARRRATWGGPLGALGALWDLTERSGRDAP